MVLVIFFIAFYLFFWEDVGYALFFYVFMLRKAAGRLLYSRNNLKHRNMNNILNYNGQSSIDHISEVIERNRRIVEELNAMYDSVRRF